MSFSTSGTLRFTVKGLNEIIAANAAIAREFPRTKTDIHRDGITLFFKDAQKNAHVITGKTKASIHIESITSERAIISAGFGMPHEEKRGGTRPDVGTPHKTFSTTAVTVAQALPPIIKKHIDALLNRHKTR